MPADVRLTAHFHLSHFTAWPDAASRGLRNEPLGIQLENLGRLAKVLELVRGTLAGAEIQVLRAFRRSHEPFATPDAAGDGRAVDFIAPSFGGPREICAHLVSLRLVSERLVCAPQWVHLEIAPYGRDPRRQIQTALFEHGQPLRYMEGLL